MELKKALTSQGYFDDLENILKSQTNTNDKGGALEFGRVQKEIKDLQNRISLIWSNQSKMQLSEEALKLASDELNRLAKQKSDLEKYLATLNPKAADPYVFKEQSLFVENQIRWCMQGWPKANPAMRKRLLRRTIKEIIVTRTELWITFWISAEERDLSFQGSSKPDAEDHLNNVVAFNRRPQSQLARQSPERAEPSGSFPDSSAVAAEENLKMVSGENRNLSILSSGNDKIGSERRYCTRHPKLCLSRK